MEPRPNGDALAIWENEGGSVKNAPRGTLEGILRGFRGRVFFTSCIRNPDEREPDPDYGERPVLWRRFRRRTPRPPRRVLSAIQDVSAMRGSR